MSKPFKCISDFIFIKNEPKKSDLIIVLGGNHTEKLIKAGAKLYKKRYAPKILITGGKFHNHNRSFEGQGSEFNYLSNIAISEGVSKTDILKEDKAQHSFDNARLSWNIVKNMRIKRIILVCKSFHARRALLTFQTVFPLNIEILIYPVVDDREIQKNNWFLDSFKIDKVMLELEKIGKYFGKHVSDWADEISKNKA